MKKFKEMCQDPNDEKWAAATKRFEEKERINRNCDRNEGYKEGYNEERVKEKIKNLNQMIKFKFHIDAHEWLGHLNNNQLAEAIPSILSCSTYEELQASLAEIDT